MIDNQTPEHVLAAARVLTEYHHRKLHTLDEPLHWRQYRTTRLELIHDKDGNLQCFSATCACPPYEE